MTRCQSRDHLLIVIGGIGFLTWDDIYRNRHHISRYRMQSKVILSYSLALIFIPAILFLFLEFQDIPGRKTDPCILIPVGDNGELPVLIQRIFPPCGNPASSL